MTKTLIAVALLSAASLVHAAPAPAGPDRDAADPAAAPGPWPVLYRDKGTDSGSGAISQNFEASYEAYDSAAADDFTVPVGSTWTIREVDVIGAYYNGSGPADSENVTIYKATHGKVGRMVASYSKLAGADSDGSLQIPIPATPLGAGTYFVSVVVNMAFTQGGEWGWENMRQVHGLPPEWENPGGSQCQTWTKERKCFGGGGRVGDHFFTLRGTTD
jgi:hypothetical protein